MEISLKLDITGFSASNGWIDGFKKRHKVAYSSVCGETASVDQATVDDWKRDALTSLLENNTPQNIFNEAGLFLNLFKDKSSEILAPLVIGHVKKPRCFKKL